jgi:hypothetical protein
MEVTKEQLTIGLRNSPKTFEEFRTSLKTYSQVMRNPIESFHRKGKRVNREADMYSEHLKTGLVQFLNGCS